MTQYELACKLAQAVFDCAHGTTDKVQRLQLMGGTFPDHETNLGGLCLDALATLLSRELERLGVGKSSAQESK